jgi:membrane protease YdiL (CAAX protease family)
MNACAARSPLTFFFLVFALSVPVALAGALTTLQLLPGLPVSALMFVCPALAAFILEYKENKTAGVIRLLQRSCDYERITAKTWYVPILILMPCVTVLAYGLMRLMGPPPPFQFPVLEAPFLFSAFFLAALGEELGWSGYVTEPLQQRWSAFEAGVLLGLVWAIWHWAPLLQAHRSPAWIAWWSLYTVASRVLMVWLYNNTGKSVFAVAIYHAVMNTAGSFFRATGLIGIRRSQA